MPDSFTFQFLALELLPLAPQSVFQFALHAAEEP